MVASSGRSIAFAVGVKKYQRPASETSDREQYSHGHQHFFIFVGLSRIGATCRPSSVVRYSGIPGVRYSERPMLTHTAIKRIRPKRCGETATNKG